MTARICQKYSPAKLEGIVAGLVIPDVKEPETGDTRRGSSPSSFVDMVQGRKA
jgi:hypothetical protein